MEERILQDPYIDRYPFKIHKVCNKGKNYKNIWNISTGHWKYKEYLGD